MPTLCTWLRLSIAILGDSPVPVSLSISLYLCVCVCAIAWKFVAAFAGHWLWPAVAIKSQFITFRLAEPWLLNRRRNKRQQQLFWQPAAICCCHCCCCSCSISFGSAQKSKRAPHRKLSWHAPTVPAPLSVCLLFWGIVGGGHKMVAAQQHLSLSDSSRLFEGPHTMAAAVAVAAAVWSWSWSWGSDGGSDCDCGRVDKMRDRKVFGVSGWRSRVSPEREGSRPQWQQQQPEMCRVDNKNNNNNDNNNYRKTCTCMCESRKNFYVPAWSFDTLYAHFPWAICMAIRLEIVLNLH